MAKTAKTEISNRKVRHAKVQVSLTLALALAFSPLAVLAEGEAITNNSLPVQQPAPSQLVQKIWGSLDIRKLAKKRDASKTGKKAQSDSTDADKVLLTETKDSNKNPGAAESASTAAAVTSTGQIVMPVDGEKADGTANAQASASLEKDELPVASAVQTGAVVEKTTSETETKQVQSATENTTDSTSETKNETASTSSTPAETNTQPSETPISIASNLISLPPGSVLSKVQTQNDGVAIVDNDEAVEVEETIQQEELPTDDGKTRAKAGARFPVVISSQITSKTAKKGDPIQARLKYDLKIGDRLVAKKGAMVNGHVNYVLPARTILHSLVSPERWYRNSGCLGLSFDEIVNDKGEHLPLSAQPSRQARIVKNKAEGRELGVNHYGQVTGPWATQLRYKAMRIGLNAALAPAGVFTFGAMPVALGVLGAANPSFAFSKPVGLNVRHRRLKGFAWGFLSGVPGSWLIEDTTVKGQEAIIKPGDEFYAELVQEFTGEPASDAQLMPGASTKLHGQILSPTKKDKKKKTNGASQQETR